MHAEAAGRVALVVGADDEIGEAIARRLASTGVRLALTAADPEGFDTLLARMGDVDALKVRADGRSGRAVADCVEEVLSRYGRLDILVNNARELEGKPLRGLSPEDIDGAVGDALAGPLRFMREAVPRMQENGYGRVVNVSELGWLGLPGQANIAAARAGLFGLTRSAALESARDGVTVNSVVKGEIATAGTTDAEREQRAAGIPVKRLGTPADVAHAVAFFVAESSAYVTGQTFFVCGAKSVYFSMSV